MGSIGGIGVVLVLVLVVVLVLVLVLVLVVLVVSAPHGIRPMHISGPSSHQPF